MKMKLALVALAAMSSIPSTTFAASRLAKLLMIITATTAAGAAENPCLCGFSASGESYGLKDGECPDVQTFSNKYTEAVCLPEMPSVRTISQSDGRSITCCLADDCHEGHEESMNQKRLINEATIKIASNRARAIKEKKLTRAGQKAERRVKLYLGRRK